MNIDLEKCVQKLIAMGKKSGSLYDYQVKDVVHKVDKNEHAVREVAHRLSQNGIKVVKKSATREWVESIVVAFLLAMFIRTFFIQAYKIPSGSMRMTLIEGDRLMVNKLRYGPKVPLTDKRIPGYSNWQRGDIIVFVFPEDKKRDFIKRLIALGGETVEIRDGSIFINGQPVQDPDIRNIYYFNASPDRGGKYGLEGQIVKVPKGSVFVLGDNSSNSHDSRYWGFVPEENIIGQAKFIYWPLNRIRWIQ